MTPPGLYIHIPFCLKKCGYCSFYSVTELELRNAFVSALLKEMELYRGFGEFDTVYFGGGTPSLLSSHQIEAIIRGIRDHFSVSADAEWSFEANPGDLTESYCRSLIDLGFNRINIGVQSFDDSALKTLGRRHGRREAFDAVRFARSAGFGNIGLDCIYGIPGQNAGSCIAGLKEFIQLAPEHLSCYQLTIEQGTPLSAKYDGGIYSKLDSEEELDLFLRISESLSEAGYEHYEVSNYARRPEFRSRHNCKYWDHTPYLGLGPAAHSFDGKRRWWNSGSLQDYCGAASIGNRPIAGEETLGAAELRLEALALAMRTADGIAVPEFEQQYGKGLLDGRRKIVAALVREGLIFFHNGRLSPTRRGLSVADALAAALDGEQ